jgi:hypothetical protein
VRITHQQLEIVIHGASGIAAKDFGGTSDPFVDVHFIYEAGHEDKVFTISSNSQLTCPFTPMLNNCTFGISLLFSFFKRDMHSIQMSNPKLWTQNGTLENILT